MRYFFSVKKLIHYTDTVYHEDKSFRKQPRFWLLEKIAGVRTCTFRASRQIRNFRQVTDERHSKDKMSVFKIQELLLPTCTCIEYLHVVHTESLYEYIFVNLKTKVRFFKEIYITKAVNQYVNFAGKNKSDFWIH